MPLVDIGGGIKQFVPEKESDALTAASKSLGLIDLVNRIQNNAVNQRLKQIDIALKGNELINIETTNALDSTRLINLRNEERRKAAQFFTSQFKSNLDLFRQSPELGVASFRAMGLPVGQNKDGTLSISFPTSQGGTQGFTIDPNKIANPEVVANMEKQRRDSWIKESKEFGLQNRFLKNMVSASTQATGQADIALLFGYMKILDPNSIVRPSELALAQTAPGIPERFRNFYNRHLTATAPFLGPVGSPSRQKFIDVAIGLVETARKTRLDAAKFIINTADNINPRKVLAPIGSVNFFKLATQELAKEAKGQDIQQIPETEGIRIPDGTEPRAAGVVPPLAPGETPAPASRLKTDDLVLNPLQGLNLILQQNLGAD